MTRKHIQIVLAITLLASLLGFYYWFIVLPSLDNSNEQEQVQETNTGIFGITTILSEGWSQEIKEGLIQENAEQETIEFKKDNLVVRVTIRLFESSQPDDVFTGFIPETREYLITTQNPVEIGEIESTPLGRITTSEGYSLVDLDSFVLRDGQDTYIYELPILTLREGFETKTVITYIFNGSLEDPLILDEADKLILSLNTNNT
jgi:hypothetical protein